MALTAPTILLPESGSKNVDPLSPILLAKSYPQDSTQSATTETVQIFTTADYGSYTNMANLLDTGAGYDTTAATCTAGGKCACLIPKANAFAAADSCIITNIQLRCKVAKTYTAYPYQDETLFQWYDTSAEVEHDIARYGSSGGNKLDSVSSSTTAQTNTESANLAFRDYDDTGAATFITSSLWFFRKVIGKKHFTVAELEAVLPNCRLTMQTYDSPYSDVTLWSFYFVEMKISFYSTNPTTQRYVQWQVSTDNTKSGGAGTAYDTVDGLDTGTLATASDYYTIPAEHLAGGSTWYAHVRWSNDASTWSAYSSDITFATIRTAVARLFHEPHAQLNLLTDAYIPYTVSPGAWALTSGQASTYEIPFDRDDFWPEVVIHDMAETTPGGYTEKTSIATVEATASTWWWDEANTKLYVHTSTGAPPNSFILEFMIILRMNLSQMFCVGGADDEQPYIQRVVEVPSVTDSADLHPATGRAESAGLLVLANHDGFFYKWLDPGENFRRTHGRLLWSAGWITIKAAGRTSSGDIDPDNAAILLTADIVPERA